MVNGQYLPAIGGVERQMQQRAMRLRELGHDVLIVTYRIKRDWPREEVINGTPVVRTSGLFVNGQLRRRWGLATIPAIWELIKRRHTYDVIHAQELLEFAWVAVVAGRLLGKPVVLDTACSGHFSEFRYFPEHDGIFGRWMLNAICRSKGVFVARGTDSVPELLAAGIPSERVRLIPYGVDTQRFRPRSANMDQLATGPRRCICTARLVPQKALDVLLRAWQEVVRDVPDASLQIVGGGPLREELLDLRHQLGLDASVEFVGETDDVAGYLARSDLYVLSSRAEGLPNALLEAMATRLPCVATRVGGTGDVIHDGTTGLLVEAEDVDALAGAILRFMRDPDLASGCGQRARALVEEGYSATREVERSLTIYEQVLGPR
jgi:glycosyltransferase involved in cell wall biosynthesis